MLSIDRVAAFALVALIIIVIPGPSVLFVVGRALAHGRRTALASVFGNELGAFVSAAAVALGIGSVVERSVLVFTALKLAGAAYIVYLGIQAIRHRRSLQKTVEEAAPHRGDLRTLGQGFIVGVANPKTIVFFAAVLPQFVDRSAGYVPLQMLILGLVFVVIALICDSAWGLAAATARAWLARSPRRLAAIGGTGGLMMIGLGVSIATTGRRE